MTPQQHSYYRNILVILDKVFLTQSDAIKQAATLFAECVKKNGIIQAFGSGHSFAAAVELAGRAGGLVNTRAIDQFYGPMGWFDSLAGSGDTLAELLDLRANDCFVIISNSGTKPLNVELARKIKEKGIKLIVITQSRSTIATAAGCINDYADVIVENGCSVGDSTVNLDDGNIMTGPASSLSAAFIINNIVVRCIEMLLDQNITPPVMRSINIPGGKEYNEALLNHYRERILKV